MQSVSSSSRYFLRQLGELRCVSIVHARLQTALGERFGKPLSDPRRLVRVVYLIAADTPGNPRLRHALGIANRHAFGLERQIPRRSRAGVEMLMEPGIWRHDHRPFFPLVAPRLLAFRPHQRITLAAHDDDVRARTVRMRLLVAPDAEL